MSDLGRFVWYDLMTNDQEGAEKFYCDLFGWEMRSMDMGPELGQYRMIHVGEDAIGGIGPIPEGSPAPPHWFAYIAVDDVDACVERVGQNNGQVYHPPTDIPNVGRFAIIADPSGAVVAPFKTASEYLPETPPPAPVGHVAWNELLTTNVEASKAFYTEVFGYGCKSQDMGEWVYHIFTRGDKDACGMMQMPPDAQAPSHWLPYLAVEDVDAKTAALVEAGGKTWTTLDLPGIGKFSSNQDPQGAAIALYQPPAQG